jgi:putative transposase
VRENHSKGELDMAMKKHRPEQIVALLRQIEVEIANGKSTPQACKDTEITVQTYYRWRKEFGGLKLDQAKRMKELEKENSKLKRLVAELSLEKQILKDVASGNF